MEARRNFDDDSNQELKNYFEFRNVRKNEGDQVVEIELICFPPHEACTPKQMKDRVENVSDLFLVAVDKENGKIAGFLNGIATNEDVFRDEFFMDYKLHDANGKHVMLLGLDVLPEYRGRGLAKEIVTQYISRERGRGRQSLNLTCLEEKVEMYQKMGFENMGISGSTWGNEQWYDMKYML